MDVSVVIPAYNVEPWIARAVDSALAQQPPAREVIVVDDGSTDATPEILRGYGDRIEVIRQDNAGLAAARNAGAERAGGDAICFLDADDALVAGALEAYVEAAARAERWGAITCNWIRETADGDTLQRPGGTGGRELRRDDLAWILRRNILQTNSLIAADTWRRFPFRDHVTKDIDLWIRLLLEDLPIVVLAPPLVRVRASRPGALTTQRGFMRANRRRTFMDLWPDPRLTRRERFLTAYQLVRTTMGEISARQVEDGDGRAAARQLRAEPDRLVRATAAVMGLPGFVPLIATLDRGENPS